MKLVDEALELFVHFTQMFLQMMNRGERVTKSASRRLVECFDHLIELKGEPFHPNFELTESLFNR